MTTPTVSTLIDHTGRVLMVWQGEPPREPESVREFIRKITRNRGRILKDGANYDDKRKRGKVLKNG